MAGLMALAPFACVIETKNNPGGGTGGGGNSSSSSTSSSTGSSMGTGGASACANAGFGTECDTCLQGNCCDETAECIKTDGCLDCVSGKTCPDTAKDAAAVLFQCVQASCNTECIGGGGTGGGTGAPGTAYCGVDKGTPSGGKCIAPPAGGKFDTSNCNPITNEGCDTASGAACDANQKGGFSCFAPPNDVAICGTCDASAGPFCKGTSTCYDGKCAKYCCDDTDCGPSGKCDLTVYPNNGGGKAGACIDGGGGTGGAGGGGGAGGSGTGGSGAGTGGAGGSGTGGAGAGTGGSGAGTGGAGGAGAGTGGAGVDAGADGG
jgi:hypothetical protein